MTTTTIQDIFEMRKNGQFEAAYQAVLPMYREHHGHYTTLCMFWTATDVMRLRIQEGRCADAEQLFCSIRQLYPNLQDKDQSAARTLTKLALQLATKEQELRKQVRVEDAQVMTFSLLTYMHEFGASTLREDDWQVGEMNGHPMPSFGLKIVSRIFHEITGMEADEDQYRQALDMVQLGLMHAPHNKHMLRYQANLLYRVGEKEQAIALYRQLIGRSEDSYLYSELSAIVDDAKEKAALLAKAIQNQRTEVFAQKDRLTLAVLVKDLYPQNAAYELQLVEQLRDSIGLHPNRTMMNLQKELEHIAPATVEEQKHFYFQLMVDGCPCA